MSVTLAGPRRARGAGPALSAQDLGVAGMARVAVEGFALELRPSYSRGEPHRRESKPPSKQGGSVLIEMFVAD